MTCWSARQVCLSRALPRAFPPCDLGCSSPAMTRRPSSVTSAVQVAPRPRTRTRPFDCSALAVVRCVQSGHSRSGRPAAIHSSTSTWRAFNPTDHCLLPSRWSRYATSRAPRLVPGGVRWSSSRRLVPACPRRTSSPEPAHQLDAGGPHVLQPVTRTDLRRLIVGAGSALQLALIQPIEHVLLFVLLSLSKD